MNLILLLLALVAQPLILDHATAGSGWHLREATETHNGHHLTFRLLLWTHGADSVQVAVTDQFGVARQITIPGSRTTSVALSINRTVEDEMVVNDLTEVWPITYYATPFTNEREWGETLVGEYVFRKPGGP